MFSRACHPLHVSPLFLPITLLHVFTRHRYTFLPGTLPVPECRWVICLPAPFTVHMLTCFPALSTHHTATCLARFPLLDFPACCYVKVFPRLPTVIIFRAHRLVRCHNPTIICIAKYQYLRVRQEVQEVPANKQQHID